ncbi:MAG: M23 family metallopeptidase [Chitinophagales bacterium]
MQRNKAILILFIFSHSILFSQSRPDYPRFYFRNPLNIPMHLSANFGELRPDHWHMGLDIRTNKKENLPVYAAAGGYIAKIRIEKFGYGRCIFINHPNGLTTVYGHLNDFFPALEKYVTEQQYKKQSWEIELNFTKQQFPVFKSQLIAFSGSTGNSQGPHLHFEIRDTKTTKCLNPLLFGFPMKDDVPPDLIRLAMYDRSLSVYEQDPQLFSLKKTDSGYIIPNIPVIQTGLKKISFAIQAFDRMSNSSGPDGIYAAKIYFGNKPLIGFVLDSIDYNETVYMNAQIDYRFRYNGGAYLQHLSQLPGDHGVAYKPMNSDGVINLMDSSFHLVHIEVKDAYNNKSQLNFMVQYIDSLAKLTLPGISQQQFIPNQVNVFEKPDFELYMPENCLYDTVPLLYYRNNSTLQNAVSALHQVSDPSFPLHTSITVRIKPDKEIPDELKDKIIIKRNDRESSSIHKAEWEREWLSAKFGDFGSFQAFVDTVPPVIKNPDEADTIDYSPAAAIIIEARDNFGGIKNFRAELDSQWIRFTNDKGSPFVYNFDERCSYGVHQLKVTVEDLVGNTATKTWWFRRYPYTPPKKKVIHRKGSGSKKYITGKKKTIKK